VDLQRPTTHDLSWWSISARLHSGMFFFGWTLI